MTRTTSKDLDSIAARLSRMTGKVIAIEYAYGQPRAYIIHPDTSATELSPRLPAGQLADWLWAFEKGYHFALDGMTALQS